MCKTIPHHPSRNRLAPPLDIGRNQVEDRRSSWAVGVRVLAHIRIDSIKQGLDLHRTLLGVIFA